MSCFVPCTDTFARLALALDSNAADCFRLAKNDVFDGDVSLGSVEFAELLRLACERAVSERYSEPMPKMLQDLTPSTGRAPLAPALIKSLDCIAYQACDWSGWDASCLRRLVDALCGRLARAVVSCGAEYEAARWG